MTKTTMLSFHGKQEIKDKYLARLRQHAKMDEIIQGKTGPKKGCAVWCTLDKYSHAGYEEELGISRIIARLEDRIFEGLPVKESKTFPIDFLEAVPVGIDVTPVWRKMMIWLLVDETHGVIKFAKTNADKKVIQDVADAFTKSLSGSVPIEHWDAIRKAARSAAQKLRAAADAAYAADADAAYAAAAAAAYAAAADADAAYAAAADADADADAYAAYAADAAAYAADAAYARKKFYLAMRDKLIVLLKEAA